MMADVLNKRGLGLGQNNVFNPNTEEGRAQIRAMVDRCVRAGLVTRPRPSPPENNQTPIHRRGPFAAVAVEAMSNCKQAFTKQDIAARLQITPNSAANYLFQWSKVGWIAQERFGEWKKTKLFGQNKPI